MSIIIEDKEDIELLLFFFEQCLLSAKYTVEIDNSVDLRDRINQIEKWCIDQSDSKKNFARKLLAVQGKVNKILELVELNEKKQKTFLLEQAVDMEKMLGSENKEVK